MSGAEWPQCNRSSRRECQRLRLCEHSRPDPEPRPGFRQRHRHLHERRPRRDDRRHRSGSRTDWYACFEAAL
eukprot:5669633-Pyramimonas_sp.AAC.1